MFSLDPDTTPAMGYGNPQDTMQPRKIGRSPWQSFLDMTQQGQNVMQGGEQGQQQQQRKGILGGIKEIGSFFL